LPARIEALEMLGRKLPPGVPPQVLTRFWTERMTYPCVYHRLRVLPDEYIDAVLAGLRAWSSPASTFLIRAMGKAPTPDAVRAANKAFYNLDNLRDPYTPKGRATILAVLAHRPYLAAVQAVVAVHGWNGDAYGFTRALVYDGSNASVAVLRQAALAGRDADRTELLKFARHAQTRAMKRLFAELLTRQGPTARPATPLINPRKRARCAL
jgi:hypothetical protein